jgi:hypothetical protein
VRGVDRHPQLLHLRRQLHLLRLQLWLLPQQRHLLRHRHRLQLPTFTSITACASCGAGFGLQTTNGVTSCVAVNLANCANATTIAPFTCITCNQGFFPNANGACTPVSQTIANCLTYDTATTCSRCASNSVLNVARTVCNQTALLGLRGPELRPELPAVGPRLHPVRRRSFFVNGTCSSCSNNTFAAAATPATRPTTTSACSAAPATT